MRKLLFALCLAAFATSGRADEVVIKLATLAPQGSTWHNLLKELAERWSELSQGKVKLKIYAGGTQGNEGEMIRKHVGPELSNELRRLSNAYLMKLTADYEDFKSDPRCPPLIATANEVLNAIKSSKPGVLPEKR